jgi:uncharacterized membrane protein
MVRLLAKSKGIRDGWAAFGARRALDERYARGEIDREEYLQRLFRRLLQATLTNAKELGAR